MNDGTLHHIIRWNVKNSTPSVEAVETFQTMGDGVEGPDGQRAEASIRVRRLDERLNFGVGGPSPLSARQRNLKVIPSRTQRSRCAMQNIDKIFHYD